MIYWIGHVQGWDVALAVAGVGFLAFTVTAVWIEARRG